MKAITGKELAGRKWLGMPPMFDPAKGTTVRAPLGAGPGFWAGAPGVIFDDEAGKFYLCYRLRRPLKEGRGFECRVAESEDGFNFRDIWTGTKEQFNSPSIERSALLKTPEGRFRIYVSYVSGDNGKWQIDVLEADSPEGFDPATRQMVLHPDDVDSEGVKDPYIFILGGMYYMFVPYGPKSGIEAESNQDQLHGTGNVFATSRIKHPTGLAVSPDGLKFRWMGDTVVPGEGWDRNVARVSCVLWVPPVFCVFYDGRTGQGDVYEDRTGLSVSLDLVNYHKVTPDAPILQSPEGSGALRYMDAVPVGDEVFYYYEYCRADGSHELRVTKVRQ